MNNQHIFLCGLGLLSLSSFSTEKDDKLNILLINIDDLGWSDLGFVGSSYYETPNIDRLRTQAVYFPNAYASASNSAPSRASLMTGQYSARHGIYTVPPADRGRKQDRRLISSPNRRSLPQYIMTLPKTLQSQGYTTYHIGKWHLSDNPLDYGFDYNVAGTHKGHPHSYFSPYFNPNLADGDNGEHLPSRLNDEAIAHLSRHNREIPFFLNYAPYSVHTPLQAPDSLVNKYRNKTPNKSHYNPVYAAMIEVMDTNVGRLLHSLDTLGYSENTLIIFTSDNGGLYRISKQTPLRSGKGSFYEGGIRIPLLIKHPDTSSTLNSTCEETVSHLDFYPTILDLLNVKIKNHKLDGYSIAPLIRGDYQNLERRVMYWHFPAYLEGGDTQTYDTLFRARPLSVVQQGGWKLIRHIEDGSIELYNLNTDIGERHNLSLSLPLKVLELSVFLDEWLMHTQALIPTEINPFYKTN